MEQHTDDAALVAALVAELQRDRTMADAMFGGAALAGLQFPEMLRFERIAPRVIQELQEIVHRNHVLVDLMLDRMDEEAMPGLDDLDDAAEEGER
ncbi:MAG: hypothetical protein V2J02_16960 [Pseudomonadales bacterium]|jgi:hypothetical protein|nr:hypothetical protein [Pseudomonadales bacterium]